jgi:hypothetical protein
MRSGFTTMAIVAALALAASAHGGPITKQNGSEPVIAAFTPICAVPGYADYGLCGGSSSTFGSVGGRMNAVQPKAGRYNLDFSFSGLTPGSSYRLWATRDAVPFGGTWTEVGRGVADASGSLSLGWQTTSPGGLGFDLNTLEGDTTIVTSWWSGQSLVVNADGSLATAG